jgi:hypothetical protein
MWKSRRVFRGIVALAVFAVAVQPQAVFGAGTAEPQTQTEPDIRFVLQTQGGLAAYTAVTNTIPLNTVRPLFTSIAVDGPDYLQGAYTLAGRTDEVQLAIGAVGWVVAWQPPAQFSPELFDCPGVQVGQPAADISRPERALGEVTSALGLTNTVTSYYDFRNPQASGVFLHWLYTQYGSTQTSIVTLPLADTYLERGYAFCTALTNSEFWLNSQLIDSQGSLLQVIYRVGTLAPSQLRAGQTNAFKIDALSLFGQGFLGGVSVVYTGTTPLVATGGYSRTLPLAYPAMLGAPLAIYRAYLPLVER